MISFLVAGGLLGLVAWLILRARNKLRRAEEEARARELAFLQELAVPREPVPRGPLARPAPAVVSTPVAAGPSEGAPPGAYLSAPSARAFRLLKTALPGHEIFPRGSLRRVVGPSAPAKDLEVDFVVCSAELRPVAVVDLVAADDLPPVVSLKAERLAAAGVAYARWDAQALPNAAAVAALVRGRKTAPTPPGAASGGTARFPPARGES